MQTACKVLWSIQRGTAQVLDPQPPRGKPEEERTGIGDLLRHPGAGFGDIAVDQQSRHACGSSSGCICLAQSEKRRTSQVAGASHVHAKREASALAPRSILALPCDGVTNSFDHHEACGAGTNHPREQTRQPGRFNGKSRKRCADVHGAG